jgi:ankyrin repeat protein
MDVSQHVYNLCEGGWNDANYDVLKVYLEEHPDVKVDLYRGVDESLFSGRRIQTSPHMTSHHRSPKSTELLLDHKADINARTRYGDTCLTLASRVSDNEDTALLLIERGANINLKNKWNEDALHTCVRCLKPSIAFTLLCCGSDIKEAKINIFVTQAKLDACIAEYKQTHAFIETYHESLTHTLSDEVKVDTRLARTSLGIYHEPLERVLEYLGLSMHKNQTVNTSIDGQGEEEGGVKRVLIPNQARNAEHWYDLSKQ